MFSGRIAAHRIPAAPAIPMSTNATHRPVHTRRDCSRGGYSLLEVVLASTLTIGTLVPAMSLLREGMQISDKIDNQLLLANYATRLLEQQLAVVAANWTSGALQGDLAADGYGHLRYVVSRSDDALDGGIPNRLMNIQVTTYIDANGDDGLSAGEVDCTFTTKVGKLANYETKAGT